MTDLVDPIDKGRVNGVVFDLLDHLDEWYGRGAEIEHVLVVVRATDAGGDRRTDVVTGPGTPKEEALGMLARAHAVRSRPAAGTGGGKPGLRGWWRRVFGGRGRARAAGASPPTGTRARVGAGRRVGKVAEPPHAGKRTRFEDRHRRPLGDGHCASVRASGAIRAAT